MKLSMTTNEMNANFETVKSFITMAGLVIKDERILSIIKNVVPDGKTTDEMVDEYLKMLNSINLGPSIQIIKTETELTFEVADGLYVDSLNLTVKFANKFVSLYLKHQTVLSVVGNTVFALCKKTFKIFNDELTQISKTFMGEHKEMFEEVSKEIETMVNEDVETFTTKWWVK